MPKRKKTGHRQLSIEATNEQLYALWDTVVEMGDDGVKGYIDRDFSARIKIGWDYETIRNVSFMIPSMGAPFEGAIVHKNRGGQLTGRLYATADAFAAAWRAVDTKTGLPPWRK